MRTQLNQGLIPTGFAKLLLLNLHSMYLALLLNELRWFKHVPYLS